MTRKKFSENFKTYGEWLKAQPRNTRYAKRIIRMHGRFPNFTLKELKNVTLKDHDLSTRSWKLLTSQEKTDRNLSLQILRALRKDANLTSMLEKLGVSKDFAIKNLGKYLYKENGRWKVTKIDKIQSEMRFYDRDSGHVSIVTSNSKDRSLIFDYFLNVEKALKKTDPSILDKFKDKTIVDAEGKVHYFETDLDRLYEIAEAQEEPEFLEIYKH